MAGFIGGNVGGTGGGGVGAEELETLAVQMDEKLEVAKAEIEISTDEKDELVALNANRYAFENNVSLLETLFNPASKIFSLTVDKNTVPDVNLPVVSSSKYAFIKDENNTDSYVAQLGKTVNTLKFSEMFDTEWHQDLNMLETGTLPLNGKKAFFLSIDLIQIAQNDKSIGAVLGDRLENSYNDLEAQASIIADTTISVNLGLSKGYYEVIKVNRNGNLTRQNSYGNISSNYPYHDEDIHYGMTVCFIIIPKDKNVDLKQYEVQYITASAKLTDKYIVKPTKANVTAMSMPTEAGDDKRQVTLNISYMSIEQLVKLQFIIKYSNGGEMKAIEKDIDTNMGTNLMYEIPEEMTVGDMLTVSIHVVANNIISEETLINQTIE